MTSMRDGPNVRAAFSPERVNYRCFPSPCLKQDYDRTVERYIDKVKRIPGILGIGRYGNVTAPGISDLDLVVITEPELPRDAGRGISIEGLPEFERNLFMHEPTVMPVSGPGHVFEHLDVPSIEPVWGCVPAISPPAAEERKWHEIAILMEWLGCFSRFFGEITTLEVSNVRWALPVLHSLRYSIRIASGLIPETPALWRSFPESVESLRTDWFGLPTDAERLERLSACLADGWTVTADLCCRIERWIRQEALLPSLGDESAWSLYSYEPGRFAMVAHCAAPESLINEPLALARSGMSPQPGPWDRIRKRCAPSWCLLPRFHEAFAQAAASAAPTVHGHMKRQWVSGQAIVPMKPQSSFEKYLCVRMERLEHQAHYLERSGLGFGSASSDLVYVPSDTTASTESWRRRLLLAGQRTWASVRARAIANTEVSRHSFC